MMPQGNDIRVHVPVLSRVSGELAAWARLRIGFGLFAASFVIGALAAGTLIAARAHPSTGTPARDEPRLDGIPSAPAE
jgi:hypothetical protein